MFFQYKIIDYSKQLHTLNNTGTSNFGDATVENSNYWIIKYKKWEYVIKKSAQSDINGCPLDGYNTIWMVFKIPSLEVG